MTLYGSQKESMHVSSMQWGMYLWKQKWKSFSLNYNKKKKESSIPPNGLANCFK